MNGPTPAAQAPRIRLAKDIDLSRAKRGCRWCNGTGFHGWRTIPMPDQPDGEARVRQVCRCVTRRGGVAKDSFDQLMEQMEAQLADGSFGQMLAQDIRQLPPEARKRAVEQLRRDAQDERKDERARKALQEALAALAEPPSTEAHDVC